MAMNLIRTQAGDGIFVNLIKDDRFKHDRISVNFILPLSRETATGYALLPFLMQRGYAGCSDFTAFPASWTSSTAQPYRAGFPRPAAIRSSP